MKLDRIEQQHFNRDFEEACALSRQLDIAGDPRINSQHLVDLNRFCDCCEDSEGYDIPGERMRSLSSVGLVTGGRFGYYTLTDYGQKIRDAWWFQPEKSA